jgi:DNA-binding NarL/FixJ family response regulator
MVEYGYSVLLVDDERAIRAMLRRWLARHGMSVCAEAATGEQALTAAQLYRPGAIVLDHGLPDIPGIQLLPQLRQLCPDACIVLFTADQAAARAVHATGAAAGLVKGSPLADLYRALTAATDAQPSPLT